MILRWNVWLFVGKVPIPNTTTLEIYWVPSMFPFFCTRKNIAAITWVSGYPIFSRDVIKLKNCQSDHPTYPSKIMHPRNIQADETWVQCQRGWWKLKNDNVSNKGAFLLRMAISQWVLQQLGEMWLKGYLDILTDCCTYRVSRSLSSWRARANSNLSRSLVNWIFRARMRQTAPLWGIGFLHTKDLRRKRPLRGP